MFEDIEFEIGESARILIAGASATGKSEFVKKCLIEKSHIFARDIDTVIWFSYLPCSATTSTLENAGLTVEWYQGIADLDRILSQDHPPIWWKEHNVVVVLDDVAIEAFNSAEVGRAFSIYAHHLPMSALILITQSLTITNSRYQQLIIRQLTHVVLTKSRRLQASIRHFGRELFPDYPSFVSQVFRDMLSISTNRYDYICILPDPQNDRIYAYKGIFPNEQKVIYSPSLPETEPKLN